MGKVIALRTREQLSQDDRAAELPHRRDYSNPSDTRIGSPLGRAAIMGLLSKEEFDSACAWGAVHSEYLETIKNPDSFTDEACERAAEKYKRGMDILNGLPLKDGKPQRRVLHAVMALAAYGEDWGDLEYTVAAARIGLKELPQKY